MIWQSPPVTADTPARRAQVRSIRSPAGGWLPCQPVRRLAAAAAGVFVLALGACAADPPRIPPEPLVEFEPEQTFERLWQTRIGETDGRRFQPFVSADAVFAADTDGDVISLDRQSGKPRWQTELDWVPGSGVAGDRAGRRVYVSSIDGLIQALAADDGAPLWDSAATSEVLVPVSVGQGSVVVRSADGRLAALDADDGGERWSVSNTPPSLTLNGYSQPLLLDNGVLVGLDDGRVLALNLDNGREIWESVLSVPSGRTEVERLVDIDADIRVDDDAIYVVNYQGRLARLEPGRGQIVWSQPLSSTAGIALVGSRVIAVNEDDEVAAYDKQTGQAAWTQKALRGRRLGEPVVTADGNVLVADFEGYLHLLAADDGRLLGRTRVGRSPIAGLAVASDGLIVVQGSSGSLAALRAGS